MGCVLFLCFPPVLAACGPGTREPDPSPTATVSIGNDAPEPILPNPDGTGGELLLTRFTDIILSKADGSDMKVVTKVSEEMALLDPTWSPDGNKIAFSRQRLFVPRR